MSKRISPFVYTMIVWISFMPGCASIETLKTSQVHQEDVLGYPFEEAKIPVPEEKILETAKKHRVLNKACPNYKHAQTKVE